MLHPRNQFNDTSAGVSEEFDRKWRREFTLVNPEWRESQRSRAASRQKDQKLEQFAYSSR
jgi:hypothetical protein